MNAPNGLEAVFMAQRAALARYLRARQRGDGETEDLLQDLWIKIAALEPGPIAEPTAYLYRMAENLLLDRRRAAMRRANRETEWTKGQIDGTMDNAIDGHPSAERVLMARDHLRQVNTALEALPEKTAFAFRAVRIDGTPQKEIAATLGLSLSAVEKHLQRAYRAILDIQHTTSADSEARQRRDSGGAKHDRN
jgi:RNA polymerase sigma factor (sigma-70 family)